ncbi:MAG: VWA domain-containing protein [Terriglobia bacterium]
MHLGLRRACSKTAICWGIALALACLPLPGRGQSSQQPAASQKDADVKTPAALASIHIQSSLVQAPVTVLDPSGQFVENLSEGDFHVLDNGVPQRIAKFGLAQEPVALVIVVQNNRGVAPLLDQVKPLGVLFSDLLVGHKGEAAVITFDDDVDVAQNFSSSPDVLTHTLQHITSDGSKVRLNDALGRAILMLAKRPTAERRVIIAFCEGLDRGSETTQDEIVHAATNAEIAIYGLQFSRLQAFLHNQQEPQPMSPLVRNMAQPAPQERPQTPTSVQTYNNPMNIQALPLISGAGEAARGALPGKNLIETYAAYTGGTTYTHWKANDLQKQLTRIALEVNSQYVLAYVPSTLRQPGFHRLQVQVSEPKLKVRTRAGYFDLGNAPRTAPPR